MQVAETLGETKGGKSQQLTLAEDGRLAVHSSLGSQQQGQSGSDSDSSDFGTHPPHPHVGKGEERKAF